MAQRCALALVLCTGCFFKPEAPGTGGSDGGVGDGGAGADVAIDAAPALWLPAYTRRRRITMTRPAQPAGPLDEFPVSVLIESDNDLRDFAGTDASFVFTDSTGQTIIDYEIRRFAKLAGTLEAWASVPSLPVGTTDIYLYYSGPERMNTTTQSVWGGAFGIWHMDNNGQETDVMGNVGPIGSGGNLPSRNAGIVGFARTYGGSDHLCVDQNDVLPVETKPFSFSLWAEVTGTTGTLDSPISRGASDSDPGFAISLGTGVWESKVTDGSNVSILDLGLPSSSWTHFAVSVDNPNDTVTAYVNGQNRGNSIMSLGSLGQAARFCIGNDVAPFRGVVDEVRVWADAHGAPWFATEQLNLATRSTFMTVAPAEVL